jgi:2-oxoglutarate dehydrogenase E1 component
LLRHPLCVSKLEDFTTHFNELIDDETIEYKDVNKVVFCSGKVYYDLLAERKLRKLNNIALIRLEQLYPVPYHLINKIKEKYSQATKWIWAQEEPENMGPLSFIHRKLGHIINFEYISIEESGVTATGSSKRHAKRQKAMIDKVFDY